MTKFKPVEIQYNAFVFCRYSLAALLWLSIILQSYIILIATAVIFGLSALLTVKWAPMIVLYTNTLGRFIKSQKVLLDIYDIQFVHSLAFGLNVLCLLSVLFIHGIYGWIIVFLFACLKSLSAVGYCPASKLRSCVLSDKGTCCSFIKKI